MWKSKRSAVGGRRSAETSQPPGASRRAPFTIVVALGSNLGNRSWYLRRAVDELRRVISVVRVSSIMETEPVDAPPPRFLNMVVVGHTRRSPEELLDALMAIEKRLGRRHTTRNAPRVIDLDLILHSAHVRRTARLTLPHPRYREREFVMAPLREVWPSASRNRRPAPRADGRAGWGWRGRGAGTDSPSRRSD
jgi:2-amino-4-hydroxy-6-hydroxymethyldihydropteridine diphosphokinase